MELVVQEASLMMNLLRRIKKSSITDYQTMKVLNKLYFLRKNKRYLLFDVSITQNRSLKGLKDFINNVFL